MADGEGWPDVAAPDQAPPRSVSELCSERHLRLIRPIPSSDDAQTTSAGLLSILLIDLRLPTYAQSPSESAPSAVQNTISNGVMSEFMGRKLFLLAGLSLLLGRGSDAFKARCSGTTTASTVITVTSPITCSSACSNCMRYDFWIYIEVFKFRCLNASRD